MAREMLLAGVDPEELKPTPKAEPPKTPKGKWENFWYHYKWAFWGTLFGVIVLGVLVGQLVTRDPADYHVLLMTKYTYLDRDLAVLEQELAAFGEDIDGDGKVEVLIQNCGMGAIGSQEYSTSIQTVQAHLMAGDVLLFVWEPTYYEQFMKSVEGISEEGYEFLTPLSFENEGVTEDGKIWDWKTDPRREKLGLKTLPEQLYFGVRNASGTAGEQQELHQQCVALLEAFATGAQKAE